MLFDVMVFIRTKQLLIPIALAVAGFIGGAQREVAVDDAEAKALEFLKREVPAWEKDNGCYSCHNNGDGARALYAATRKGYSIPRAVLAGTTEWVSRPERWDENKGDPGFSDKRLANVQFAASLLAAFEAGLVGERGPIERAARKLAADQDDDGSWKIDAGNTPGSPATYGTPLATWMALRTLREARLPEMKSAVAKAERWLGRASPVNVLTAASLLPAYASAGDAASRKKRDDCLKLILAAQTRDGGWGPYADSPPEAFDTALVLIALAELRNETGVADAVRRGRRFLVSVQHSDGSWPATTRPSGGDSYAQLMSTTGWAALALMESRD
jgi:hypothetical protein